MNERSHDPLPEDPARTAVPTNLDPSTVQSVSAARSPRPDPYATIGLEISDVLRDAHEAAERTLAAAELEANAIRAAADADRAVAEQDRAHAITELLRAKELRKSLDTERLRLRARTEALAATQSRNADRDRGIEVLLLAALEILRTDDASLTPALPSDEAIDLRDAALLEPRADETARPNSARPGSSARIDDGEPGQSEPPVALPTPTGGDALALAIRGAVARALDAQGSISAPSS